MSANRTEAVLTTRCRLRHNLRRTNLVHIEELLLLIDLADARAADTAVQAATPVRAIRQRTDGAGM